MDPRLDQLHRAAAARPDVLSLAGGLPAPELLPRTAMAEAAAEVPAGALQYGWPEGELALRTWIAERLKARGAAIGADDVVITAGAQQALSLVAACLPAGARVAVDRETYPAAMDAFALAGHAVVTDGPADLAYVIDGVSNPHGVDRVGPRRAALLAGGAPIVVDEAYVELRFDGRVPRPLLADARDRVWHVGSCSKTIGPGLRIGWLVPPKARLADVLARKQAADLQTGALAQHVLARWLETASYDGVVERARNLYGARAERLARSLRRHLPGWRVVAPEGGFSLWVEADLDGDELELLEGAIGHGVVVDPGAAFRAPGVARGAPAFRLSFSHAPIAQLDLAVQRLARAAAAYRPQRHAA